MEIGKQVDKHQALGQLIFLGFGLLFNHLWISMIFYNVNGTQSLFGQRINGTVWNTRVNDHECIWKHLLPTTNNLFLSSVFISILIAIFSSFFATHSHCKITTRESLAAVTQQNSTTQCQPDCTMRMHIIRVLWQTAKPTRISRYTTKSETFKSAN